MFALVHGVPSGEMLDLLPLIVNVCRDRDKEGSDDNIKGQEGEMKILEIPVGSEWVVEVSSARSDGPMLVVAAYGICQTAIYAVTGTMVWG
ncbi:hypothetical protein V6N12_013577 [Hibiscus sabdariffa]|uniref:Uncharacterized protein n=1 Tax=Hibiscus sabdariffa TaxID=183260 RepID=A0ABR2C9U1_9ROSI